MNRDKLLLRVPVVCGRAGTGPGIGRVQLVRDTDGVKRVINLIKVGDNT